MTGATEGADGLTAGGPLSIRSAIQQKEDTNDRQGKQRISLPGA